MTTRWIPSVYELPLSTLSLPLSSTLSLPSIVVLFITHSPRPSATPAHFNMPHMVRKKKDNKR